MVVRLSAATIRKLPSDELEKIVDGRSRPAGKHYSTATVALAASEWLRRDLTEKTNG